MKAKILYGELKRLVDATREFAARNEDDCIHNYIRMEFHAENDEVRVCGYDGCKLSIEWGKCKDADENFTAYIKPNTGEILGAYAWSWDDIEVGVLGSVTEVKVKNASLTYNIKGMKTFIDVDTVIPKYTSKLCVGFNPKYMMSILNAELAEGTNSVKMELCGGLNPIVFRSETKSHENIRLLSPVRLRDKSEAEEAPTRLGRAAKLAKELIDVCNDTGIFSLDFEGGLHINDNLFSASIPSDCVTTAKWDDRTFPYIHKAVWHGCPVFCLSYKKNLYEQKEEN